MTAAPPLPYRRALVVVNPIAGRGRGESSGEELRSRLSAAGVETTVLKTKRQGDAREQLEVLAPEAADLVVAVGGDGTIGEVLEGLSRGPNDAPVAVLPMGTGNVLSIDLGLPRTPEGLFEMLPGARAIETDLASAAGRVSFMVTGVGVDGAAAQEVERLRKGPITMRTWVRAGLSTFFRRQPSPTLRVELDGEPVDGRFAFVLASNVVRYGRYFRLSPERKLDDGLLEVYLFTRGERRFLFTYLLRGLCDRLLGSPLCTMARAAHVKIESEEPIPCQVDGDYAGTTPLEIRVLPDRARLLVPHDSPLATG